MEIDNLVKISIISPSYNQGAFIEDAILSVLDQEYENFEHIIIDGGSTDNTIDILKKYPHLKWVSEKDKGQSDAINKGFDRATGDVIGWLNTDDFYLPGAFNSVLSTFNNSNADVIYGDINFVNRNKTITRHMPSRIPVKWLILFHCYIHSASFFFKRTILDDGIRIDPDLHIAMDKDFFAHIFYKGFKFNYLKRTLTAFRWHENNKSIDSNHVKQIRYREGLTIYNKYSSLKLPMNSVTFKIYAGVQILLLPYSKLLKLYSRLV